jgi:hypothetical protein
MGIAPLYRHVQAEQPIARICTLAADEAGPVTRHADVLALLGDERLARSHQIPLAPRTSRARRWLAAPWQLKQLTTHVSADLAAEVMNLAASRGVSVSAAVEVLMRRRCELMSSTSTHRCSRPLSNAPSVNASGHIRYRP